MVAAAAASCGVAAAGGNGGVSTAGERWQGFLRPWLGQASNVKGTSHHGRSLPMSAASSSSSVSAVRGRPP